MIRSVDRAVQILLVLQGARRLGVTEIAGRLGLPKATVHGLLRTLAERGMVEQEPQTGKYMLGAAVLRMGNVYLDNHELRARSLRWADGLAERTGHPVRVGVLLLSDVVVVHHAFRPDGTTQIWEVGIAIPAHASSLGKAMLAFRRDDLRRLLDGPLRPLTGGTIIEPERLSKELEEVRRLGVATERDEAVLGESGIAGTVFDASATAVGAIGVVVPSSRLAEEDEGLLAEAVRAAARAVSKELGAPAWPPRHA
ncbi:MAG: IclR family transcriptional regulator [Actinomycetota bacterium]|nr:IclR family transcriptional regulator [Actinomycetota bacterium]